MIKWLHLSDFHFGKQPHSSYQQPFMAKKIIEHIGSQLQVFGRPDFVFITGDIANSGKEEEFKLFNDNVIEPIVELLGYDFLDNIFAVPGNHDVQRGVAKRFGRDEFLKLGDGNFEPSQESNDERFLLHSRLQNYVNALTSLHSKDFLSVEGSYCEVVERGGLKVGIVGINTAWLCRDESDRGNLTPGIALVRRALEKAGDCDIKIVLGHHPIDWLAPSHVEAFKSLLSSCNAIYMHGHMHNAWGRPEYANGSSFMTIQAGASFQAAEGEKWKNSLLWGELDFDAKHISLQPFAWEYSEQAWKLSSAGFPEAHRVEDRWCYKLPSAISLTATPKIKEVRLPGGWDEFWLSDLSGFEKPINELQAVNFFDGATPSWEVAISNSIPRREIVDNMVGTFSRLLSSQRSECAICTLLAAGCEGKTTALLQASFEILKKFPGKKILFRKNNSRPFEVDALLPSLTSHNDWLVVIDEADQVAKDVLQYIESGLKGFEGRIDFLLACRDSDWKASEANSLPWSFSSAYKEVVLKDLSKADAEKIVAAWESYGPKGLGEGLANLDSNSRVEKLRYYAKKESRLSSGAGAFYGALLLSRHNGDLLEHAESMLHRLDKVEVKDGKTLKDALGYIAAMHAEGFDKLTFDVLASTMGLTVPKVQRLVTNKLGQEAAATSTSTTVFTRHKYIAEAVVDVLETKFDVDITYLFIDLVLAASERSKTDRVPNLDFWRFKMADALYEKGKTRVAISLSEALLKADSSNHKLLTKLAKFYRKEGSADDSVRLFRDSATVSQERAFYFEWSVCEGEKRNKIESATLALFAMSDDLDAGQLEIPDAVIYLNGLSIIFSNLHRDYEDQIFVEASEAASSLIVLFTESRLELRPGNLSAFISKVSKKRATLYRGSDAVRVIIEVCSRLDNYKAQVVLPYSLEVKGLAFDALKMLVRNVERN